MALLGIALVKQVMALNLCYSVYSSQIFLQRSLLDFNMLNCVVNSIIFEEGKFDCNGGKNSEMYLWKTSFENTNCYAKPFGGAKNHALYYYAVSKLQEQKPDIAVVDTGDNTVNYKNIDINVLADNIVSIGKLCNEYGGVYVVISEMLVERLKLSSTK